MATSYVLDPSGTLSSNRIRGEKHILTAANGKDYHFIVPLFAPYFEDSMVIKFIGVDLRERYLIKGVDWLPCYHFVGASRACAKPIFGGVEFLDKTLAGVVEIDAYQTLGGTWTLDAVALLEELISTLQNPRVVTWEQVSGAPSVFPPVDHEWNLVDMVGMKDAVEAIDRVALAIAQKSSGEDPTEDPFKERIWTRAMLGLDKVGNYPFASDEETIHGNIREAYTNPVGVKKAIDYRLGQLEQSLKGWFNDAHPANTRARGTVTGRAIQPVTPTSVDMVQDPSFPGIWPTVEDRSLRAPAKGWYQVHCTGVIMVNQLAQQRVTVGVGSAKDSDWYSSGRNFFTLSTIVHYNEGDPVRVEALLDSGTPVHLDATVVVIRATLS